MASSMRGGASHGLVQNDHEIIGLDQIDFVQRTKQDDVQHHQQEIMISKRSTLKRGPNGQAIVFPKGPQPLPMDIADEDLPVCDSSGAAQITLSDHYQSFNMKETPPLIVAEVEKNQIISVEHVKEEELQEPQTVIVCAEEEEEEGAFRGNSLEKLLLEPNEVQLKAKHKKMIKVVDSSEHETRFTELFPKLNDQAIDLLVRASEPENALDLMRQALSELNAEKKICEGMPAYRHTLLHKSSQVLLGHSTSKKLVVQASVETAPCTAKPSLLPSTAKKAAGHNTTSSPVEQQLMSGATTSSKMSKQSLLQVQHKDKYGRDVRSHIAAALSPPQQKPKDVATGTKVSGFDKQQLSSRHSGGPSNNTAKQSSYIQAKKGGGGGGLKAGQSTNFASSNSTCEPSSNLILGASSNKSSLITTPTNPSITALTQNDLKARTRESNLIVCLYYNLACCYQRMGLLEEAVEYLELASDQLEDTVQYFEMQEEYIIKQRQVQPGAKKPPYLKTTVLSQYATEEPQKTTKLEDDQRVTSSEYGNQRGKTGTVVPSGQQSSRLLPAQPTIMKPTATWHKMQRQHSADSNKKNDGAQLGKKGKVLKRDQISIKNENEEEIGEDANDTIGESQQHLSYLLKESQKAADLTSSNTNMLIQKRKVQDHMLILHHSAEQLKHTKMTSQYFLTSQVTTSIKKIDKINPDIFSSPKISNKSNFWFASFTNNQSVSLIEKNSSSGGRNVSPVTTASMPLESSNLIKRNKNDPNGLITIEQLLAEKMHKTRYQCKMNLQICALQSQLGKHQDALLFGRRAAQICYKLIKNAQMLCKRYVAQIQRHIQARQTHILRPCDQYGNTLPTQPDQGSLGDSPNRASHRLLKAQTEINDSFEDDYQSAQFSRRPPLGRIDASSYSTNSKYKKGRASSSVGTTEKSVSKRPLSSCSSKSHSSLSSRNGLTRLRLSKGSLARLLPSLKDGSHSSRESSNARTNNSCRDSSAESLDKIHTFNLRNSQANYAAQRQSQSVTEAQPALLVDSKHQKKEQLQSVYQKGGPETSCSGSLKVSLVDGGVIPAKTKEAVKEYVQEADPEMDQNKRPSVIPNQNRNVYIEESVKVLESLIIKADPLLQELASIVKEFEDKSQIAAIDRDQDMIKKYGQQDFKDRRRRLKISFTNLQELTNLERDQRFKLNVRNTLGVKNSQDWIFNLNIGNVMHLNMMREQELNAKIENTHELTKDTMLEKVVLITSSYFCIATEIRFILQKDLLDVKSISKKDSEAFHAKALHIALLFLPEDCPLSQYINQTYCKNYLQPKLKLQKQRNAYLSQKLSKQHQTRQKMLAQTLADKEQKKIEGKIQTTESKRALTSLLAEHHFPIKKPKMHISTKSYEGLCSGASTIIQTPVLGGFGSLPPKTSTAALANSAQQGIKRKSGVTPDLIVQSKTGKKPGNTSSTLRSQAGLKIARPSVTTTLIQAKKARKSTMGTSTLHRASPSIGSLLAAQFSSAGTGTTASKLWIRSPTRASCDVFSTKKVISPRQNQTQTTSMNVGNQSGQKTRDGSSVRKIKINLGQLSMDQRPQPLQSYKTTTKTTSNQRNNSSLRMPSKQKQTVSSSYGNNVPAKHIQSSLQVKQSLGDQSNTLTSAAGANRVGAFSSTLTATAARISSGPSSNPHQQSDAQKQHAIMISALKHLQIKQHSAQRKRLQ